MNSSYDTRAVRVLGRIVVLLGIVFALYKTIDPELLLESLTDVSLKHLLAAISLFFFVPFLMAYRLAYVADLSAENLISPLFQSYFFNVFLPANIGGDIYKVTVLSRLGRNRQEAVALVVVDRVIGVTSALLLALIVLTAGHSYFQDSRIHVAFGAYVGAVVAVYLVVIISPGWLKVWTERWRLLNVVSAGLLNTLSSMRHALYSKMTLGLPFAMLIYAVPIGVNVLAMMALGLRVQPAASICYMPVIAITTVTLPISFNGLGVRESLFVLCFRMAGYTSEEALAMALVNLLASFSVSVFGGILVLLSFRQRPPE